MFHDKKRMLKFGIVYIFFVFLTYLAMGFGLLFFIQRLNIGKPLNFVVAIIVIILGLTEIKDYFRYGKGISLQIPKKHAKKIMHSINNLTFTGSILLGVFVAAAELPCTGGPYIAITSLLADIGFSWDVFIKLFIYNIIFVFPLIVILFLVYFGMSTEKIKSWKEDKKKWMRLFMGLVMVTLGVLLILINIGILSLK